MGKKIAKLKQPLKECSSGNSYVWHGEEKNQSHGLEGADNEDLIHNMNKLPAELGLKELAAQDAERIHRLPNNEANL